MAASVSRTRPAARTQQRIIFPAELQFPRRQTQTKLNTKVGTRSRTNSVDSRTSTRSSRARHDTARPGPRPPPGTRGTVATAEWAVPAPTLASRHGPRPKPTRQAGDRLELSNSTRPGRPQRDPPGSPSPPPPTRGDWTTKKPSSNHRFHPGPAPQTWTATTHGQSTTCGNGFARTWRSSSQNASGPQGVQRPAPSAWNALPSPCRLHVTLDTTWGRLGLHPGPTLRTGSDLLGGHDTVRGRGRLADNHHRHRHPLHSATNTLHRRPANGLSINHPRSNHHHPVRRSDPGRPPRTHRG